MSEDEQQIRDLVTEWMDATRNGNSERVSEGRWRLARDANLLGPPEPI